MENYRGDLADIVRGGVGVTIDSTTREVTAVTPEWQFPSNPTNYSSGIEERLDDFGDPFPNMQDPLLHDIDMDMASPVFLTSPGDTSDINPNTTTTVGGGGGVAGGGGAGSDTNMFSRMLQISPTAKLPVSPRDSPVLSVVSPRMKSPPMLSVSNGLIPNAANSKRCLVENAGLQISSPRIAGIKRRKTQAKKVVCIPAPAPANSRSSGEVVPSDLWAWRKYGQKPIKGSPYPRGYYRCSSSKGCSARKQVERSRTDPNMLVITYTSEHNHPWPTQRNALAGSTRAQPNKNNNNNSSAQKSSSSSVSQPQNHRDTTTRLKEEQKNESNTDNSVSYSSPGVPTDPAPTDNAPVKEEMEDCQKKIEMEDVDQFGGSASSQSYKPALPDSNHSHEDFFADLGEIEVDPLNLLFTQENKALDPFSFYDWPENYGISNSQTQVLGEAKKGLQPHP